MPPTTSHDFLRYEFGRYDYGKTIGFLRTCKTIFDWVEAQLS